MLRPERMSKVSVTGAKPVMGDIVETVHELHLLHLSEYDGSWEGFDQGNPAEGADDASQKLVTVRSLRSTLGVKDADPEPVDDLEGELESIRRRTNELDDRRSEIEDELRSVEERVEALAPFRELAVDLDLLAGYRTVETAVGRGDAGAVQAAVEAADGLGEYELRTSDDSDVVAVFARPTDATVREDDDHGGHLEEALVGVAFEPVEAPAYDDPNPRVETRTLRERAEELRADLEEVEAEIADLSSEVGGVLVAAENRLTVQVQKAEAPLAFATTQNSFVAEGWIPTDRVDEMEAALRDAVGDRVEFEELRVAEYDDGHPERVEEVDPDPDPDSSRDRQGGEPTPATDGGVVTMRDPPPTTLDNSKTTEPMETLVKAVGLPKYSEFDPTFLVFLTFPVMFGFMIGDVAYGLLYMAVGYGLYSRVDSPGLSAIGGVGMWAGLFTVVFGVLYGEVFGLHFLSDLIWGGSAPIHKGLQPKHEAFAVAWLVLSLVVGLAHVGVGYLLGFIKELRSHGLRTALFEEGSWLFLMFGAWAWIFSTSASGSKPLFIYNVLGTPSDEALATDAVEPAIDIGFTGLPEIVGLVGLALAGVGFVMLVIGEGLLAVEVLQSIVNVLSYVRLMAVLLAKAGLAFVVNLLVFGAYEGEEGEFHFLFTEGTSVATVEGSASKELMFGGLLNTGDGVVAIAGLVAGAVLIVVGHLFVLALGITSAGLQGVRLEYVEFFGKFYDGGGKNYDPFGHSGNRATED
jgi:Archaeal/vacuolar-type H+-ATPase subunit I